MRIIVTLACTECKEEIIRRPRISEQRRISWSLINIAAFAESTRRTKRPNKRMMQASSSNGRASDSKSGCWGFESLLACHTFKSEAQSLKIEE